MFVGFKGDKKEVVILEEDILYMEKLNSCVEVVFRDTRQERLRVIGDPLKMYSGDSIREVIKQLGE